MVAEGLRRAMKPVIEEVTKGGGSRAEREVAIVLRAWNEAPGTKAVTSRTAKRPIWSWSGRVFQQKPKPPGRRRSP